MNLSDLKRAIQNDKIENFYIFSGEEFGIRNLYINKIAEKRGLAILWVDTLEEIWRELNAKALFGGGTLFVVYNDKEALTNTARLNTILREGYIRNGMLILVNDKVKAEDLYADKIVGFTELPDEILLSYCNKYLKGGTEYYLALVKKCNNSYTYLMNEIDKIKAVADERGITHEAVLEKIIYDKSWFNTNAEDVIFDLIDKILRLDMKKVFNLLGEAYKSGDHPLTILTLLYQNYINILKYCGTSVKTTEKTGLNYYQLKACELYTKTIGWDIPAVLCCLDKARRVEIMIKRGQVDPHEAIEFLILDLIA